MPSERFYINADLQEGKTVALTDLELHHLAHVMRIRINEEVELVNGRGSLATARLTSLSKKEALLEPLTVSHTPIPTPRLILGIPLMRPAKLELIVEKSTELGADAFWFYPAEYSEKNDLSPNQLERLNYLAISAMKQCGRLDLPPIKLLKKFTDLFTTSATYLFGDTRPGASSPSKVQGQHFFFISGPEKGFSPKELHLLDQKAQRISLNKNILRAETAPLAATCLLN